MKFESEVNGSKENNLNYAMGRKTKNRKYKQ